jgi:hypothetical protein
MKRRWKCAHDRLELDWGRVHRLEMGTDHAMHADECRRQKEVKNMHFSNLIYEEEDDDA